VFTFYFILYRVPYGSHDNIPLWSILINNILHEIMGYIFIEQFVSIIKMHNDYKNK